MEGLMMFVCITLQDGVQTDRSLSLSYLIEDPTTSQVAGKYLLPTWRLLIQIIALHLRSAEDEFNAHTGDLTILAGGTGVCIQGPLVSPLDDSIVEDTETFIITLESADIALSVTSASASLTILDNDGKFPNLLCLIILSTWHTISCWAFFFFVHHSCWNNLWAVGV